MPIPGDTHPFRALFYNSDDDLTTPTTPLVDVFDPDSVEVVTDATPTVEGPGDLTYDYVVTAVGTYRAHFSGIVEGELVEGDDVVEVTEAPTGGPSLVTFARYRTITLDLTSTEGAVTGALVTAQNLVEEYLRRELDHGAYTERLRLIDGRVYPKAYPLSDAGELSLEGTRAILAPPQDDPVWNYPQNGQAFATVTYTGGLTAETLPETIEREIAWTAYNVLHPSPARAGELAGALSVSQGDSAVTFARAQTTSPLSDPSRRVLRPYRNLLH